VAQQVLSAAASASPGALPPAGAAWAALDEMARSASGRAALEELAGRAGGESALEELQEMARGVVRPVADLAALEALAGSARARAVFDGSAAGSGAIGPAEEAADVEPVPIEVLTGGADLSGDGGGIANAIVDSGVEPSGPASLLSSAPLTKMVLARRSDVVLSSPVAPLALLAAARRRSPGAYAFALRPSASGGTFIGITPERLFSLEAGRVATEAVAGTRPRGADERADAAAAYDMLTDAKEHAEQRIVQEWVRAALLGVCRPGSVVLEAEKQLLRAGAVQHLYSRLSGALAPGATEADVLAALHPTPAVCGAPRRPARDAIAAAETFDRGFYAGPVGWMGGGAAEFAVAIRSALAADAPPSPDADADAGAAAPQPPAALSLFAGVGVVRGAAAASEWRELNLKISQYEALLTRAPSAASAPNVNAAWATLLVEEAVRCGVRLFCIAPGSRSTPLALAAARHPRAGAVVCLDERSLCFHALGASKAGRLAAVITSSGTAVANLLPAAVETAEAEVPLLLLTADRPPELRGSGANQTIDQVGIFGTFTRWAAEVPPPDAQGGAPGAARQLLTTVDLALHRALGPPAGPVHLNCAFREPLAPSLAPWSRDALAGLERWHAGGAPLTLYTNASASASGADAAAAAPLAALVARARRGVIVAGHLPEPADALAVAQLAARLGWPLVADVASGLRVRAAPAAPPGGGALLPHFDLALMERGAWDTLAPDCVLQFGARLTSKRLQAFLEWAALERGAPWAFVARHPWRHDPGHAITLRMQAAPAALAAALMAPSAPLQPPGAAASQAAYAARLGTLDARLRRAVDEHLEDAEGLTEMAVSRLLSRTLPEGHALFLGNSMPVRDMDMYADVAPGRDAPGRDGLGGGVGVGAAVACNRGASGIDGVVSTASGFAAGLGRPTTLLIGDVSFAHDANGMLLLRERPGQPPLTVVVVNNGGGAIFNFLPVAATLDGSEFGRLFSMPPDVRLAELCRAHRVHHLQARTPRGLALALAEAWRLGRHAVLEVSLRADDQAARNLAQHRAAEAVARAATRAALCMLMPPLAIAAAAGVHPLTVAQVSLSRYGLPLRAPLTSGPAAAVRAGALLRVTLACGAEGVGDIAPMPGLHAESLPAVMAQAALAAALLRGAALCPSVAALDGGLGTWLARAGGIRPEALHPSVRFGIEAALLAALAASRGVSLAQLLCAGTGGSAPPAPVAVNALLPACATAAEAASAAAALVAAGHTCIKVKVARPGGSPAGDAATLAAVRAAVGPSVALRADANRGWDLPDAVAFAAALSAAGTELQYVEEPLRDAGALGAFYESCERSCATALDESVDKGALGGGAGLGVGARRAGAPSAPPPAPLPPGVAALVIKPAVVGGIERAAVLARWARRRGVAAVISSAFESSVGLASLAALAAAVDASAAAAVGDAAPPPPVAHGLATADWFAADVTDAPLAPIRAADAARGMVLAAAAAAALVSGAQLRAAAFAASAADTGAAMHERMHEVVTPSGDRFALRVLTLSGSGQQQQPPSVLFLHGFMGAAADWAPHMAGIAAATGATVAAVDLPGHGGSRALGGEQGVPEVAAAIAALIAQLRTGIRSSSGDADAITGATAQAPPPAMVGYSMGARVALQLALAHPGAAARVVCVSGTAGVRGGAARAARAAHDDALARALRAGGAAPFAAAWYKQRLFAPLAARPRFADVEARRAPARDAHALAAALAAASPGRAPDLWPLLAAASPTATSPLLRIAFVAGALDAKFAAAARKMALACSAGVVATVHEVPGAGHAVHLEAPEALLDVLLRVLAE
jgi:isochorismate synthase/2-succinyl-5-enolpyruvyl-6-hydroxy-3-cyclohexene-1-carboxylate synthase/2-succinyl-6-hydroxy-2,4-cyclohexadiene-1-carboxylate synthase/O-succinylbenzoate synthase